MKVLASVSGALLGLGLRGYLQLEPMDAYITFMAGTMQFNYLASISLFLGFCANPAVQGTKSQILTRLLSIHLPFLMPLHDDENALQEWGYNGKDAGYRKS